MTHQTKRIGLAIFCIMCMSTMHTTILPRSGATANRSGGHEAACNVQTKIKRVLDAKTSTRAAKVYKSLLEGADSNTIRTLKSQSHDGIALRAALGRGENHSPIRKATRFGAP